MKNKTLLKGALLASLLLPSFAFAADNPQMASLKKTNTEKTATLKAIKAELKVFKDKEKLVKLQERSAKLDEQIKNAKAKLAESKKS